MKRFTLLLSLAIATNSMVIADDSSAIKTAIDDLSKGMTRLVDAVGNAWQRAAVKKNIKEGAKEFTTNFATQILFAGVGIASFVLAGAGIKKLIDNRGTSIANDADEKAKKEAEQKKHERRTAWYYIVLGTLGTLASGMAIQKAG